MSGDFDEKQHRERIEIEVNLIGSFETLWVRLPEVLNIAEEKTRGFPHVKVTITCRE